MLEFINIKIVTELYYKEKDFNFNYIINDIL